MIIRMVLTRKQAKNPMVSIQEKTTTTSSIKSRAFSSLKKLLLTPVGGFVLLVLSTVFAHWALVNLYITLCAPPTLYGLITTMISLGSPVCYFINIAQVELAKHYINIWASAGIAIIAWMAAKFTSKKS